MEPCVFLTSVEFLTVPIEVNESRAPKGNRAGIMYFGLYVNAILTIAQLKKKTCVSSHN